MTNTKFTPGPWAIHDNGSYLDIGVPTGGIMIPVYPTVMIGVDYENKENAHHIIKCVNYHDRLVEELQITLALLDNPHEYTMTQAQNRIAIVSEAKTLLAELEKEPTQ